MKKFFNRKIETFILLLLCASFLSAAPVKSEEEALKTLSKIDVADIKDTIFNNDLEKLKKLIGKRDSSVKQYIPGRIMY